MRVAILLVVAGCSSPSSHAIDAAPPIDASLDARTGIACSDAHDCVQLGATAGAPYDHRLVATGGTPPYRFVASGTLPAGIALTPTGELIGTPEGTSASITVRAIDANGCIGSLAYPLEVSGAGCTTTPRATFATGTVGVAFTTDTLGPGTIAAIGTLPAGVALAGDHLEGTPTIAGDDTFAISVTDGGGCAATTTYAMHVNESPRCDLAVGVTSLSTGTIGQPYSSVSSLFPLLGHGTPPYLVAASGMPPGLAITPDGQIVGVPTASGTFQALVQITDAAGCATPPATIAVTVAAGTCTALAVSPPSDGVAIGTFGQPITGSFTASGGTPPYTFFGFDAPPGVTLDTDGVLGGMPAAPRDYWSVVFAADANGCAGSLLYRIEVAPAACPAIEVAPALGPCELVSCNAGFCGGAPLPDGTLVANDTPVDCAQTICTGGVATRAFDATEDCGPATTCVALDRCSGQTGAVCDAADGPSSLSPQPSTFCDTGICRDGVCCTSDCDGLCETCGGTGECHPRVGIDPDTCTGEQICDADSACKQVIGAPCGTTGECYDGACVASYVDADQDSWGDAAQPAGLRCIVNHLGFGYTDRTGDCCDSDVHAFPGLDQYDDPAPFGMYPDACGDYDRNCNGALDYATPVGVPACTPGGGETFVSYFPTFEACGAFAAVHVYDCDGSCNCSDSSSASIWQDCR